MVTAIDNCLQQCLERDLQVCQLCQLCLLWGAQFPTPCVFLWLRRGSSQGSNTRVTKRAGITVDTMCRHWLRRGPNYHLHVVQISSLSLEHYWCYLELILLLTRTAFFQWHLQAIHMKIWGSEVGWEIEESWNQKPWLKTDFEWGAHLERHRKPETVFWHKEMAP